MRALGGWVATVLVGALLVPTAASAQSEPIKEQHEPGPPESPLEQAREEAGEPPRAPTLYALPGGQLRVTPSELLASWSGNRITFEATLDRPQPGASVSVRLPPAWVLTPPSGLRASRPPRAGRGDRLTREGRTARLRFAARERRAEFSIENVGIPAGTYALPLAFRGAGGRMHDSGAVQVRVFPAVREAVRRLGDDWRGIPRTTLNASNDASEQSEGFVAITQGNADRFAVGINGPDMAAYVTDNRGTTFTPPRVLPSTTDVPGSASTEIADVCCDPMFAANDEGDLWFGGLTIADVDEVPPSRIVVNRIAAGTNTMQPVTTGLRQVGPGTQDKPMMTIDNTPTSPTWGRLYVVWGQPGVRIAVTSCDTRPLPSQTLDAARCDNADNWSPITYATGAGTGSYIYADVAVGPDGKVYVTWWDYSAANAIEGAVSTNGGASFSAQQTIALLDDTDDSDPDSLPDRVPFACPILVQPGGRVGPAPSVEVHRLTGRVYVSWGDLRPGSGSTRCEPVNGGAIVATPPRASHLTWDVFVASREGALPGGAQPSASAGTRVSEDGTPGETPNSDDFFPWLAIDQGTGEAWIDFYSTSHDGSRQSAHFYAASAQADGTGGHRVGLFNRVSAAPSSYFSPSDADCCRFQNDFGDYQGIDVAQGSVVPVWSDNSTGDGEAFVWTGALSAVGFDHAAHTSSEAVGDGDGQLEPGEAVSIEETARNAGTRSATNVVGRLSSPTPGVTVTQGQSDYATTMAPGATATSQTPFEATLGSSVNCSQPVTFSVELTSTEGTEPVGFQVACSGAPTPTPSPSATPSPTPIASATPAPSVTPRPPQGLRTFRVGSRQRLSTVLRRGLLARLSCRGDCVAVLTLQLDARTARRYRVPRRIGRMTVRLADGIVRSQRIRVISRARRNLRRARSVKLVATATVATASGGAPKSLSARLTLRR